MNTSKGAFLELNLTPDELLTTTRAVRRRLDLDRPVPRGLIEECLRIAQQAPAASNGQMAHFVVVTDQEKKERPGRHLASCAPRLPGTADLVGELPP
ncbi:MAG TPA: nitroreductase family protein [Trebonia sp.]|nr:nitroreductase family protein [Trebonia sp.]